MGKLSEWGAVVRESTRPSAAKHTALGLTRLARTFFEGPSEVELALQRWKRTSPKNRHRFHHARSDNFSATSGRRVAHQRRAGVLATSMTSLRGYRAFCIPELRTLGADGPRSYLEFGACCGTTVLTVAEHFPSCRSVAFEPLADRTDVYEELRQLAPLRGRITWIEDIFENHVEGLRAMFPEGIAAAYLDTNHKYPNDLWYLEALLIDRPLVAPDGLVICDDRHHSGTRRSVSEFLRRHGSALEYRLVAGRWAMFRRRRTYRPARF